METEIRRGGGDGEGDVGDGDEVSAELAVHGGKQVYKLLSHDQGERCVH